MNSLLTYRSNKPKGNKFSLGCVAAVLSCALADFVQGSPLSSLLTQRLCGYVTRDMRSRPLGLCNCTVAGSIAVRISC
jgi:hypothetical protein